LRALRRALERWGAGDAGQEEASSHNLQRLVELDPIGAIELVRGWHEPYRVRAALVLIAQVWARADPHRAAAWVLDQDDSLVTHCAPAIARELERIAPASAADFAAALPRHVVGDALLGGVMARWQQSDFNRALSWARELADGETRSRALLHLCSRWAECDPVAAAGYLESQSSAGVPLLCAFVSRWAAREPQAAAAWAVRLPDEAQRASAIASLAAVWAETAPVDAARFAVALADPRAQTEAVAAVASEWARRDPGAAAEWSAGLPAAVLREQAFTQVLFAWGRSDAATAAEWLLARPGGPERDAAMSALSGSMFDRHPAIALVLAEEISSPPLRLQRIENIARRWLAGDAQNAAAALIASSAPVELVAELLSR
jgi:hypothetical protein